MRNTTRSVRHRLLTFLAAAVSTAAAPWSGAAEAPAPPTTLPSQQELLDRLNALQAEVTQLKAQQAASQSEEQKLESRQAVDAAVAAVQKDAQQHSQLFDIFDGNSVVAQHTDSGFKFHTADGNFSVNPWGWLQFKYQTTYRSRASTGDDTQSGFEVRRLKFGVDGNLFGPDLTYFLQFNVNRTGGDALLELAWAQYHFANTPFSIQFGNIKDPLDHEQIASARYFDSLDRSLVDDLFAKSEGFVKGVTLSYQDKGPLRGAASFTGGLNNYDTIYEGYPANTYNWGAAGRAEYKFFGDWKDYDTHFSAHGTQEDTLVTGLGADWSEADTNAALTHVLDAEYMTRSLFLYGAYLGRYTRDNTVGTGKTAKTSDTYDATLRFQASYAIDQHWEPYVQYEYIHFDPNGLAANTDDQVNVFRVGTSYYFHGHAAKIQTDVSYLPNGSPASDTSTGVLQDNGHSELIWRAQFQLLL